EMLWPDSATYVMPRFAPDGSSRLAIVVLDGPNSDIWIYDWQRGNRTKLSSSAGTNTYPVWTPDGRYVFFQSDDGIWWARTDGTERRLFTKAQTLQTPTSFTSDGKVLAFFERNPAGGAFIKTLKVEYDSGQPKASESPLFIQTPSSNPYPAFSWNKRWI